MEDSNLKGVVTGSLPALKVRLNQREPDTRIVFFSDSNRSLASVEFVSGQKGNSLNGYLDLLPGNFNLMRSDQPVRIMGGDKIFLTFNNRFFDPLGPNDNNFHLREGGSPYWVLHQETSSCRENSSMTLRLRSRRCTAYWVKVKCVEAIFKNGTLTSFVSF